MIKKYKNALLFVAAMLPIAAIGGYFTIIYTMSGYEPSLRQQIIDSIGSYGLLILASTLQAVVITVICGFFGYVLSEKIGLMRPFKFKKKHFFPAAIATVTAGVIFGMDYWLFGEAVPGLAQIFEAQLSTTPAAFVSGILYGGVVEEVMLRLFLMSLVTFVLWKIFARRQDKGHIPQGIFIVANVLAALLFAAGHLPATINTFGALTPLIVLRCFLYNGGLGIVFGRLYRKYGIQYAMLAHAGIHIVSKVIWLSFV